MNVRLKQVDILDNQTYDFYNDRDLYFKLMNKRVNNRFNQIEELLKLLKPMNDLDFYNQALKVYDLKYNNVYFIKSNILLDVKYSYLNILLRVNSDENINTNKYYSDDEVKELLNSSKTILEAVNIIDYEEDDIHNNIICGDDEFLSHYSYIKDLNIVSNENIKELKKVLTKDKIIKDLQELIKKTKYEIGYLNSKYSDTRLTLM